MAAKQYAVPGAGYLNENSAQKSYAIRAAVYVKDTSTAAGGGGGGTRVVIFVAT